MSTEAHGQTAEPGALDKLLIPAHNENTPEGTVSYMSPNPMGSGLKNISNPKLGMVAHAFNLALRQRQADGSL